MPKYGYAENSNISASERFNVRNYFTYPMVFEPVEHAGFDDITLSRKVAAIWQHHEFLTQNYVSNHPAAGVSVKFQFVADLLERDEIHIMILIVSTT